MDFTFTPEQNEAAELAARILGAEVTPTRQKTVEADGSRFDRRLWSTLADAGLLGLHLPEEYTGAGLGLIELARVLVECGRVVAPVPLATHAAAAAVLAGEAAFGDWVARAASGDCVLGVALAEDHAAVPEHPETRAAATGDGWLLTGEKTQVRAGMDADAFLVSATTDTGVGLFLVTPGDGVAVAPQRVMDGDVTGHLALDGAPATRVGGDGAPRSLAALATVCTCAEQLGIVEGALTRTSSYAVEREQFGRPIGSFQAVSQRLADGYIDTLCLRLTLWQAIWRLSEGLPADVEVATAKLWAADAGHRLAHTAVHVHGGVGIDLEGTTHRYFTAAKRFELAHGGATEQALTIGAALATQPA